MDNLVRCLSLPKMRFSTRYMLFTELKEAFARANETKRAALTRDSESESPAARQPWIRSYALRGNTFLMKGQSLDFFEFYRLADNAIVYETSNRGPRIWGWDSYLCDVQRVVAVQRGWLKGSILSLTAVHRCSECFPLSAEATQCSTGTPMGPTIRKETAFPRMPTP